MSDHQPTRKLARRRERKGVKTAVATICRTYNREGLAGVEGIVDAIGGGSIEHWDDTEGGQGDE